MEKFLYYILFPLTLLALSSCGKTDEPLPVPSTVHRTVIVYMVADNSLGTWGCDNADISEMVTAASSGALAGGRLIVYRSARGTSEDNPPVLIDITRQGVDTLKSYPVFDADDKRIYSVDPSRIREVLADAKTLAPAEDYAMVFWSHSNGWLGAPSPGDNRYRAFGDDRGQHITIPTLASTLEGEHFSFIYFDCCQMANVETAYQLRNLAPVIVGSPTELGIDGMRYDLNVPVFFSSEPDMEKAARNTFDSYNADGLPCQMAVMRTSALDRLAAATKAILATLADYPEGVEKIQRYCRPGETCWSYDMRAYMRLLAADSHPELYDEWQSAFDAVVTYAEATPIAISDSFSPLYITDYSGLGMFAIKSPDDITYRQYDSLAWWTDVVSACPAYK